MINFNVDTSAAANLLKHTSFLWICRGRFSWTELALEQMTRSSPASTHCDVTLFSRSVFCWSCECIVLPWVMSNSSVRGTEEHTENQDNTKPEGFVLFLHHLFLMVRQEGGVENNRLQQLGILPMEVNLPSKVPGWNYSLDNGKQSCDPHVFIVS